MESTQVLIIGAGPSGLALGLALAKVGVKSVILEKELEVPTDPRGLVLNCDAVRISYDLGLGSVLPKIGQPMTDFQFHKTSWQNKPFYKIDLTPDLLRQGLPTGILMIQPKLEEAMAGLAEESKLCEVQRGCIVERQGVLQDGVIINYRDRQGNRRSIKGSWLVGADGKKGIVRKHFLEKQADIRQVEGVYHYEGTWIAANLHMTPPTPQSHPQLPFWELGMTPLQVYDLYWPKGWHFCAPPGKPVAAGRFGRHEDRLWRHEIEVGGWDNSQDVEAVFWEHLNPLITRDRDGQGRLFSTGPTIYPRDCIEIRRCRPYSFIHKVVNKWFANHTILIGDAAHVFPPFGGQGICSGMRDAHQLAWRLAVILRGNVSEHVADRLLTAWADERRQGVDDAARLTESNGKLVNEPESLTSYLFRQVVGVRNSLPLVPQLESPLSMVEAAGYKATAGGFFLPHLNGGGKIPQTAVGSWTGETILSDQILRRSGAKAASMFAILSISHDDFDSETQQEDARILIRRTGLPQVIVDEDAVVVFGDRQYARGWLWDKNALDGRVSPSARYVVVRPDFYIYAIAEDLGQLEEALSELKIQCE